MKRTHRFYERGSGAAGNAARCCWSNLLPLGHESRAAGPARGRAGGLPRDPPSLACAHLSPRRAPKGRSPSGEAPRRSPPPCGRCGGKGRRWCQACVSSGGGAGRGGAVRGGPARRAPLAPLRSAPLMSPLTLSSAAGAAGR